MADPRRPLPPDDDDDDDDGATAHPLPGRITLPRPLFHAGRGHSAAQDTSRVTRSSSYTLLRPPASRPPVLHAAPVVRKRLPHHDLPAMVATAKKMFPLR